MNTDRPDPPPAAGNGTAGPRPGRWVLLIVLAAIGLFAIRQLVIGTGIPAREWSSYNLGRETGSLFLTLAVPAILALIWWGARGFSRTRAKEPLIAWAALTALFGLVGIKTTYDEVYPPEFAKFPYRPAQCEFQIGFPVEPVAVQVNASSPDLVNEKQLITSTSLLRAGCLEVDGTQLQSRETLSKLMAELGTAVELRDLVLSYGVHDSAPVGTARGLTVENDEDILYEFRLYVGDRSALLVTTAGQADYYPPGDVARFVRSVKRAAPGRAH